MKYPKVTIAQIKPIPMDIKGNLSRIFDAIDTAKNDRADMVVFPELSVSGYVLGDRFEYEDFIDELDRANEMIKEKSEGICIIWGNIVSDKEKINEDGRRRKYNAVLIAQNGAYVGNGVLQGFMPKNNLPKYRIFDDARHFYPGYKLAKEMGLSLEDFFKAFDITVSGTSLRLGLAICEDMWEDEYAIHLSKFYKEQGVDLLIDISASPWTLGKWHAREAMLTKRVHDVGAPILYVNCVGLQNNGKNLIWFDGASTFISTDGIFLWRGPVNNEAIMSIDLGSVEPATFNRPNSTEELYSAMTSALYDFYKGFKKIVVGLSGGIDSAVALALLREVVPEEQLLAINMPTKFNSQTTQSLAETCAKNLDVEYKVVPINDLYEAQLRVMEGAGLKDIPMLVKENIQARIRGQQLASISAYYGGVFTNNGNKTEVALNYFTLYGDAAGAAAFLGDLWKGQVYELARYINKKHIKEMIPQGIIDIVPSAELSENQNVDEGKGDPIYYEYHDKLLLSFVEWRWGITKVLEKYANGTLENDLHLPPGTISKYFKTDDEFISNLEWAWSAYNTEYKRVQLPPVLLTSRRAFGFDRRDTIAAPFYSEDYSALKEKILTSSNLPG